MKKLISLILLFLFYIFSSGNAFAQNAKITGRLLALAQETQGKFLARQVDSPKVKVLFYPAGQKSSNVDFRWFKSRNIRYQASKNYVSAKIDASLITELKNIAGVEAIDIAFPPNLYSSIGEGVYKINAAKYDDGGYGVKIAVIDVREPGGGFKNYKTLQAKGELPKTVKTADFVDCADPLNPPEINTDDEMGNHGTQCAEIIYDIVPRAEMYLIVIDNIASFQNAVEYCVSEGINIVSISLGWTRTLLYYEGDHSEGDKVGYGVTGIALSVDEAADNGVLSVVAAGNEGPSPSSLSAPGDARKALTVGAIYHGNYDRGIIETYSSRGPVKSYSDGTISLSSATKPEITAPTGISSVLGNKFYGTSAATPHVAGAAALLLGWNSTLNSPQILKNEIITKYAKPVGGQALPNNIFGYGRLILGDNLAQVINTGNIIVYPNPVSVSKKGSVKITNIPINTRVYSVNIFTVTGQLVRSLDFAEASQDFINGEERKSLTWDLKNQSGAKVAPGVYFAVIDALTKGKTVKKIAVQK